jgi:hypothetical protein
MIWFLTLAFVTAHDNRMPSVDARTVDAPTYRIQVTVQGVRREYVRPVQETMIADALMTLPQTVIPNLAKARICVLRGRQHLDVDWWGIFRVGDATTNYQLAAGDVIVIELDSKGR